MVCADSPGTRACLELLFVADILSLPGSGVERVAMDHMNTQAMGISILVKSSNYLSYQFSLLFRACLPLWKAQGMCGIAG